ncbi:uncharacterized protein LOC126659487 isoform X2 [Mercurialis annua]|uniref:uncharacterized protein LOC126659487 isoform X2 n=1 Tax=Mercurialis annua TaxID=3986 RepID=UPI002160151B|nr:uncharacterized protein LOC126659487 isoform X2 [Mercurialis annua]
MEESYGNLPTSHLLGSVPAVVIEEKSTSTTYDVSEANLQTFPPNSIGGGGSSSRGGYQTVGTPPEGFEQQTPNSWTGVFSVSSYMQYFNVDTDIVINRMMSSFYPYGGDFFSKIDANPDLYGLIWISTTLVFLLAGVGNCATYLIQRHIETKASWSFDVGYVNVAALSIYGYTILVPLAYYFLLQYLGANASLIRFWCMWGYSLVIFVIASLRHCGGSLYSLLGLIQHASLQQTSSLLLTATILQLWWLQHSACN